MQFQLYQDDIFLKGPCLCLPVIYTKVSVYATRHIDYKICIELFASFPSFGLFTAANRARMILPLNRDRRVLSKAIFLHRV
jgi:hypothetical protein